MNVWSEEFMGHNKISRVINTAGGLDKMFPSWSRKVKEIESKSKDFKVLYIEWSDTTEQTLWSEKKWDQLMDGVWFIHEAVSNEKNVVVHCAQGKSRSSTVVCAYIMAHKDFSPEEALKFVQQKRSIAEPNISFMKQLNEFHKSEEFQELKSKMK
jgi:protein-tyrosine phosphatase